MMGQVRDGGEASGDQAGHVLHDRRARRTLGGLCASYETLVSCSYSCFGPASASASGSGSGSVVLLLVLLQAAAENMCRL